MVFVGLIMANDWECKLMVGRMNRVYIKMDDGWMGG